MNINLIYLPIKTNQIEGIWSHFFCSPSLYKPKQQFGHSCAFADLKIWNELPDDVFSAFSILSLFKKLK